MVCIAIYDESQNIVGCTRADGASGGLEFLADCEALGHTITYKTQAELDAEAADKVVRDKWGVYAEYCSALTVTTQAGNKFAAGQDALKNVVFKRDSIADTDQVLWVEDWGMFTTDKVELQEVVNEASALMQAKIIALFGV